jgi:EpsI family protein
MAVAVIMPIVANSARAYALVMVGHLSEMRLGIGTDHLLFGWVLFGVVMLLMFWIGSFWQEDDEPQVATSKPDAATQHLPAQSLTAVAVLAMICTAIWPAIAFAMNRNAVAVEIATLMPPAVQNTWQAADLEQWTWHPAQPGADRELDQVYVTSDSSQRIAVGLHLRQYLQQRQGVELVDNLNPWRPDRAAWRVIERQSIPINLNGSLQVEEARLAAARQDLLIWSWYWIDGRSTANPYLVKLLEAKQQIFEGRRQGTRVFVATPLSGDRAEARKVLQDFVNAAFPATNVSLDSGIK